MSRPAQTADVERASLQRLTRGLRMVTVPFPHLTGLAAAVRVAVDDSVPTMGVFASGRLVANSRFTARLSNDDLVFVLAHELLHLALRTHDRAVGSGRLEFNYAHDYIINDMLRHALGLGVIPAGGLDMAGARERSAEEIVLEMRRNQSNSSRSRVWEGQIVSIEQVLNSARQGQAGDMGDVLDADRERAMFPDDVADQMERARAIRDLAAKGMALGKALGLMKGRGTEAGGSQRQVRALRGIYRTPWQVALQRWLEGVSPGERTFTRASRRGADRADLVLPGRQRYSMMLHVVLDTSGSMSDEIPYALGAIADFCEATGVDEIRVIQCDTVVTGDAMLSATELAEYEVRGYGGSDLSPALHQLAEDPRVTAAIVITDGDITYPREPMPYAVLWAVPGDSTSFAPTYGRVITMSRGSS
ncbi:MAG TPA: VWA-like domain-containing protein [Beijerinckiaceae bacterium]|nr:VWA-like domain-containing protein [Beijerinckiaceae bacterium]